MDVISKESGLDTSEHGVDDDTDWEQETSGNGVHSSQGADDGGTTSQQHSSDEDVGHDSKDGEDDMGGGSKSGLDDFEESMCVWCSSLELNRNGCEEQDLNSCTRSIPKWSRDSIVVSYGGRLQQSCSPLKVLVRYRLKAC